ncbi:MAG TPA: N-acetylmuramoyl-L-alanine amidase [Gaiellaceae bacterium]
MKRLCLILAACLAWAAAPASARADGVTMRVVTVAPGARQLEAAARFDMLAFKGRGTIRFRTHRLAGGWTRWQPADDDAMWVGDSDRFEVRAPSRVRAYEIDSPVTTAPERRVASASEPAIVTRAGWGADEEIVRAKPVYAPAVKLAIVHHTVSPNTYTPAQAAAIVRGIETYHVKGNGWNDIGYNFLVDRFGNVYEGRAGGIDRNVVGAHSEGFNTGTVGISLIGSFQTAQPPKAMQDALVGLLAWRLDVAHVDPLSTVVYTSGGNAKFRAGKAVTLRAISGHRDTGPTECPGAAAYALLPAIAQRVAATGLPKLYAPTVVGVLGGPIRFQARLSRSLAWSVTVVDRSGRTVAAGGGNGALVDWTWSSPIGVKGPFAWTISAPGIRVATGTIGGGKIVPPPPLALTDVSALPSVITPAADGTIAPATLSFTLSAPATVTVKLVDVASRAAVQTISSGTRPAGPSTVQWSPASVPDGSYQLVVTARSGGARATRWADVVVDREVSGVSVSPAVFSPNHDLMFDTATFGFLLARPAHVQLDVLAGSQLVASVFAGDLAAGANTIVWDGSGFGPPLPDGEYTAVLTVDGIAVPIAVRIDDTPPQLQLVDRPSLVFSVDEACTVRVVLNGKTVLTLNESPGTFQVPASGAVTSVSAQAIDVAGNVSAIVSG